MKSVLYYMMPYAPSDLMAIRTNDDGTYSMRTLIGMYDDEYGPSKKRFDLRSWKPYVTTSDFQDTKKVLDRIRVDCLGNDMDSIGYSYGIYNQKIHAHHEFVQAGYNDKVLVVITMKHHYEGDPIDCKVAVINRKERERISPIPTMPMEAAKATRVVLAFLERRLDTDSESAVRKDMDGFRSVVFGRDFRQGVSLSGGRYAESGV